MPSLRGTVEADVDEIKLKDSFCDNTSKRTSSLAKALKKRISLTKLSKLSPEVDKGNQLRRYPTFTIEDWEQSANGEQTKSEDKRNSKLDVDTIVDVGPPPPDEEKSDLEDVMSVVSDQPSRLSVDSTMVQSGKARFYKRLSICDLKDGHTMDPKERVFLEAAERGDKHTMMRCLAPPYPVNVNCTDILGRSAIQIAVDNENVEIVELLLQQETVRIGDALLYSITEGVYRIVEMLINHHSITPEMLANDWSKIRTGGEESSDFDPNISPIILAAHCNQFEILQLLLSRGAYIDKPHSLSCSCRQCTEGFHIDSLRYSLKRIHTYRALASPAWISLTSEDPILAAFKLSWELEKLARMENEFKDTYLELSDQCKKYTCDLLHQCRSTREVIAVLNRRSEYDEGDEDDSSDDDPSRLTLSRLKLALKYNQKQFVAHPNCQQLLTSVWYEGLPVWRRRNALVKIIICVSIILFIPIISVIYLIFPRTKIGKVLRSPFMKFIYHSASFGLFLVLLILASTRTEGSERHQRNVRGPSPTVVEWLICFWVFGMVWAECKQLWEEGLQAYMRQWWNWLDFIMLSLYLSTFCLRAVAFGLISTGNYGPREISRTHWPVNDPTLIAEGVFAVANVFSFARIIYLFQTNPHLGPLQISLGCMIIDIAKFLFIFFLVLTSFACGLNQLYWYYDSPECQDQGLDSTCRAGSDSFNTLGRSYSSLLWSLFGLVPLRGVSTHEDYDPFTDIIGQALLASYMIMAITVMVNMLIAMMSRSFQIVEDHADQEWKFARSQLWMSYFDPGSTLPAPFNLIISPKSVYYCIRCFGRGIKSTCAFLCFRKHRGRHRDKAGLPGPNASNKSRQTRRYADVMRRLVSRYIHQAKKQLRQDGVNEDDLLEIKQDISSLRYELREDRKREAARAYGQVDSIKKDILRLLHQNSNKNGASESNPCKSSDNTTNSGDSDPDSKEDTDVTRASTSVEPSQYVPELDKQCPTIDVSESNGKTSQHRQSEGKLQSQKSVDLGVLGRNIPEVGITVTPASSIPNSLTYSQGNLSGCLLAPQEMDYLRKEIIRSVRTELRDLMREALSAALCPIAESPIRRNFSPTPTPSPTPNPVEEYPTSSQQSSIAPKPSTYSRAPTLEVPSSPLLSPTSAMLRVPVTASNTRERSDSLATQYSQLQSGSQSDLSISSPILNTLPLTKKFGHFYTEI